MLINQVDVPLKYRGKRLDKALRLLYPILSYSLIQKWIRCKKITVNNKKTPHNYLLQNDDIIFITEDVKQFLDDQQSTYSNQLNGVKKYTINPQTLKLLRQKIVYEDSQCIVLNKPHNLAVQGGTKLKDYIDLYLDELLIGYKKRLHIVHRLDKDTQGLLILAKEEESAKIFMHLFKQKKIIKSYIALVWGILSKDCGTISAPIGKIIGENREKMAIDWEHGKESISSYETLKVFKDENLSLLKIFPKTGRKHQIRVHLSQVLNAPIVGDWKYGLKTNQHKMEIPEIIKAKQLCLAATELRWQYDNGKKVHIKIPIPNFCNLIF